MGNRNTDAQHRRIRTSVGPPGALSCVGEGGTGALVRADGPLGMLAPLCPRSFLTPPPSRQHCTNPISSFVFSPAAWPDAPCIISLRPLALPSGDLVHKPLCFSSPLFPRPPFPSFLPHYTQWARGKTAFHGNRVRLAQPPEFSLHTVQVGVKLWPTMFLVT